MTDCQDIVDTVQDYCGQPATADAGLTPDVRYTRSLRVSICGNLPVRRRMRVPSDRTSGQEVVPTWGAAS